MTLDEKLAVIKMQRAADLEASSSAALPLKDAMTHPKDWPLEARVWFYKAGINNDNIRDLAAFWSPVMRRIVLPYRTVDGTQAWIARDPDWTKGKPGTKYLFPAGVARGGGALFSVFQDHRSDVGVAITEDALSAYRVSRDTDFDGVAAQGTSLDRDAIVKLASHYRDVAVWLDPDKYGQQGALRVRDAFARLGVTVRNIVSARDPKNHEPHEIIEALEV